MTDPRKEQLELFGRDIQSKNAVSANALGLASPHLLTVTLPFREQDALIYSREGRYGRLELYPGKPDIRLPYGALARLHFAHVISHAYRTKEPLIRLAPTLTAYARELGVSTGSGLARLREQMLRCDYLTWEYHAKPGAFRNEETGRFLESDDRLHIFRGKQSETDASGETFSPVAKLTRDFMALLQDREAAPYDFRALKALGNIPRPSPLAMDLYPWLTWKAYTNSGPVSYKYSLLMRQFGTDFDPGDRQARKNFRRSVESALELIIPLWPELRVDTHSMYDGKSALRLKTTKPHVDPLKPTRALIE